MLKNKLKEYNIVLGSKSERRKELLTNMGIEFIVKVCNNREIFKKNLSINKISEYLANQKSDCISNKLKGNYLLITADTIVSYKNEIIHKPKDISEAVKTLKKLSGNTHHVITGVCLKSKNEKILFSAITKVEFNTLNNELIEYYVKNYNPYDKAGSYGIQEWIGIIGVNKIVGSYNNVVGLPTSKLYQNLKYFM